ncbi:hypothetical protein Mal15_59830 [Stieleria maiorica]|uniref:Uncharacterized protein n=1 Tax=Stieleria maiorica TaxID=2795974 RepID=A0A5B9MKR9_9BACT|nr:hypothetical protein Mal15_59830 [Stieleria maiorica]
MRWINPGVWLSYTAMSHDHTCEIVINHSSVASMCPTDAIVERRTENHEFRIAEQEYGGISARCQIFLVDQFL